MASPSSRPSSTRTRSGVCACRSAILMEGRVFHQTGPNIGTTTRAGAFAYFVRSFLAPQFEWHRGIPRDLRADLSPWLRKILGFGQSGGIAEFIPTEAT